MELLKDCPLVSDAAYTNIVFVKDPIDKKGYIYRVAKVKASLVLMRYDLEDDEWEKLGEAKMQKNLYLTIMPMFSDRFIAILGDRMPYIFDTV